MSNNAKGQFGPPEVKDAKFLFNGNMQTITLASFIYKNAEIRISYYEGIHKTCNPMNKDFINTRSLCLLGGLSGVIGVIMIIISFNINPGPPVNPGMEQLAAFGRQYYRSILWGAWLQAVGPALIVLFAMTIVSLADATRNLAGIMAFFGAGVLMTVSLLEITFYISALFSNPGINSLISLNLIYSVQHLYFIIGAPAIFIPLGIVIVFSEILPKPFGWAAIILGLFFGLLGVLFLFNLVLPAWVTACGGIQALWWLSASVSLILRSKLLTKILNEHV